MAKRSTAIPSAHINLDAESSVPLYRQLYESLRLAILTGRLASGTRLPSTREVATELKISRNTVMNAFDQLIAEGYLEGQVGSGTFVSHNLPDDLLNAQAALKRSRKIKRGVTKLSRRGEVVASTRITASQTLAGVRPFVPGIPALDAFPYEIWGRIVSRRWRQPQRNLLAYNDPAGYRPLREAIAEYLGAARAVYCEPEQVIITVGTQQAANLAAKILLNPDDAVWVEEYSYLGAQAALKSAEVRLVPVPVDEEGLNVEAGKNLCPDARLVYVTPSHQYPLGVTMSLTRRLFLLDWAAESEAWILEDDYDSEYRYAGRPLSALQGLDKNGRVIYLGTFSKVLFPGLRLGYVVAPPDLVEPFVKARAASDRCSSAIDQAVLTDFITEGHFARHIRRMRSLYAERQEVLIEAVKGELGGLLTINPDAAGIHLVGWLPEEISAEAVTGEAFQFGVIVQPLSVFCLDKSKPALNGLVLGYGAYDEPGIKNAVKELATAVNNVIKRSNG